MYTKFKMYSKQRGEGKREKETERGRDRERDREKGKENFFAYIGSLESETKKHHLTTCFQINRDTSLLSFLNYPQSPETNP